MTKTIVEGCDSPGPTTCVNCGIDGLIGSVFLIGCDSGRDWVSNAEPSNPDFLIFHVSGVTFRRQWRETLPSFLPSFLPPFLPSSPVLPTTSALLRALPGFLQPSLSSQTLRSWPLCGALPVTVRLAPCFACKLPETSYPCQSMSTFASVLFHNACPAASTAQRPPRYVLQLSFLPRPRAASQTQPPLVRHNNRGTPTERYCGCAGYTWSDSGFIF